MSMGLTTLGMFSAQSEIIKTQTVEDSGGTYGYPVWEIKKPKVIINKIFQDEEQIKIKIKSVEEK